MHFFFLSYLLKNTSYNILHQVECFISCSTLLTKLREIKTKLTHPSQNEDYVYQKQYPLNPLTLNELIFSYSFTKLPENFLEDGGDLESFNVSFLGWWTLHRISK